MRAEILAPEHLSQSWILENNFQLHNSYLYKGDKKVENKGADKKKKNAK